MWNGVIVYNKFFCVLCSRWFLNFSLNNSQIYRTITYENTVRPKNTISLLKNSSHQHGTKRSKTNIHSWAISFIVSAFCHNISMLSHAQLHLPVLFLTHIFVIQKSENLFPWDTLYMWDVQKVSLLIFVLKLQATLTQKLNTTWCMRERQISIQDFKCGMHILRA